MIWGILKSIVEVIWTGARNGVRWNQTLVLGWIGYAFWLALVIWGPRWNLGYIVHLLGSVLSNGSFGIWLENYVAKYVQFLFCFLVPLCSWLFACGIKTWIERTRYQKCLKYLGLKAKTGEEPLFVRVAHLENTQRRIYVKAPGIDLASFQEKKGVLASAFKAIVQDIQISASDRQVIEILIADKELTTRIEFENCVEKLGKPYSMLIGESLKEFVTANLCDIHHLLIAGATGGGKSVFFKQALIGLLNSSEHIQFYLIDLKRGVELKPFGVLNNVRVVQDELSAVTTLKQIVSEMDARFKFLEGKDFNEINPKRDKLDRIVVAVDEASELFTISKVSKENKLLAESARELTDKIAKLGRAAGIHLILATQKVVKETVDTRVQANINAKICFRVNSLPASTTVLGNKKAYELPDIKGRGIWSVGSNDVMVQVPYLSPDDIDKELKKLTEKFNSETSPIFKPMLQVVELKKDGSKKIAMNKPKLSLVKGTDETAES